MQALLVLFIGALVGVSYCDECLTEKVKECVRDIPKTDYRFCYVQPKVLACLKDAARECGKPYVSKVENVESIVTELCTDGTPLNKEFLQHRDCLVKVLPRETCVYRMEEVCPNIDQIASCLSDFTGKYCGNGAQNLVKRLLDAVVDMQSGHCEDFFGPDISQTGRLRQVLQF